MKKCHIMSYLLVCILLFGCAQNATTSQIESQVKELTDEIKKLRSEINDLKQQISWLEMLKDMEGIAYLTPGAAGYSIVRSDIGIFTVKLEDIKQYANGSKVALRFGNTTSATIDGLKVKLEWGTMGKDGRPMNETAKSRDLQLIETLRAGAWTSISVVLDGVPPAELGFVRVRDVGHRGISLMKR
jgi:hypothetical protein